MEDLRKQLDKKCAALNAERKMDKTKIVVDTVVPDVVTINRKDIGASLHGRYENNDNTIRFPSLHPHDTAGLIFRMAIREDMEGVHLLDPQGQPMTTAKVAEEILKAFLLDYSTTSHRVDV